MTVRHITDSEVETYRQQGVVQLRNFVDWAQVEALTAALDTQIAEPGPWLLTGSHHSDRCFGLDVPTLCSYLLDPKLGANAAKAMDSTTARFFFDHMFLFEPASPIPAHYWHQDLPYWPVEGNQIVSIWLSLTNCTTESAALKFVPRSHTTDKFYRPQGFDGEAIEGDLGARAVLAVDVRESFLGEGPPAFHEDPERHGVVEYCFEAGDAVMFHARTLHSSGGNHSPDSRRLAYSVRFVGDDARMTLRKGVFQDPALLPDIDELFEVGAPMISRRWPLVHGA